MPLFAAQLLAAAYGAYFGAGVGIMMLAILGIFVADSLQRLNALKGLLSLLINLIAAVSFVLFADVSWVAVAVMAVASLLGGQLGVVLARRLNDRALRWLVIAFGVAVGLRLLAWPGQVLARLAHGDRRSEVCQGRSGPVIRGRGSYRQSWTLDSSQGDQSQGLVDPARPRTTRDVLRPARRRLRPGYGPRLCVRGGTEEASSAATRTGETPTGAREGTRCVRSWSTNRCSATPRRSPRPSPAGWPACMRVDAVEVGGAPATLDDDVTLLVVGGPTHAFGMSRPRTRQDAATQAPDGLVSTRTGLREWLAALRAPAGIAAAAFDTKVSKPHLPGSAARAAEKRLRRLGFRVAAPAESFYVEGTLGPLLEGEQDRAMRWGDQLGATTRELAGGARP